MNSAYYVLKKTPTFNENGLWFCKSVYFSKYGTLAETLVALVEMSPLGLTVNELEMRLRVKVGNLLSRLCRGNRLTQFYAGRHVVYLSIEQKQSSTQKIRRLDQIKEARVIICPKRSGGIELPKGLDAMAVISILIQIIKSPKSSVASISQTLQHQNFDITAEQVRTVIEFYSLKKKRYIRRSKVSE